MKNKRINNKIIKINNKYKKKNLKKIKKLKVDGKVGDLSNASAELNENYGSRIRKLFHDQVLKISIECQELVTKTNLASGVWPPPSAEDDMMAAAMLIAASIKELVNSTKTSVLEYKEVFFFFFFFFYFFFTFFLFLFFFFFDFHFE